MKTAVIISGIPRHLEPGYENLFNNIIESNQADVFMHFWADPEKDADLISKIITMYKPIKYVAEPQKTFWDSSLNMDRMMKSHAHPYQRDTFINTTYCMWYGIQQANLVKEKYRLENNINYDYVVRARFDMTYTRKLIMSDFDRNAINIASRTMPPEMIDDRFAFGSNSLMNVYCGGFNMLNYVFDFKDKKDGIFCGETIVYEVLTRFGIKYHTISDLGCGHLR